MEKNKTNADLVGQTREVSDFLTAGEGFYYDYFLNVINIDDVCRFINDMLSPSEHVKLRLTHDRISFYKAVIHPGGARS